MTDSNQYSNLGGKPTIKFMLAFTVPTIIGYLLFGVFGMVDQIFASRAIGVEAMAAVSLVLPFLMSLIAFGSMLAMGGSALVTKQLGEGQHQQARQTFTLLTIVVAVSSLGIAMATWVFREQVVTGLLGANPAILEDALLYMEPLIMAGTSIIVGIFIVQYMIASGRPGLSMLSSVSGAVLATVLNVVFIVGFDMGIQGLAIATGVGYSLPTVIGVGYFFLTKKSPLYFVAPRWDFALVGRAIVSGASEFITMMMVPTTKMVMNNMLINMDGVGAMGVASAGIAMGLMNIFAALFIGFSAGLAPVVAYNQGNNANTRALFKRGLVVVGALSAIAFVASIALASPLVSIFETVLMVDFDFALGQPIYYNIHAMTVRGLRMISVGFILMGINIFTTQWFTAFGDGLVSGFVSLMQTAVFTVALLLTLPQMLAINGIWLALPLAEMLTLGLSVWFLYKMGEKYGYIKPKVL